MQLQTRGCKAAPRSLAHRVGDIIMHTGPSALVNRSRLMWFDLLNGRYWGLQKKVVVYFKVVQVSVM